MKQGKDQETKQRKKTKPVTIKTPSKQVDYTNTPQHHLQTPKSPLEKGQHNTNNTKTQKQNETKEVHSDQALFFGFPCLLSMFLPQRQP